MLKQAEYECWGWGVPGMPRYNKVVYVIMENCCYFSGIEREKRTSTINAAESIIKSIAQQEGVSPMSFRYFDLQTHRGYDKLPGEYQLDELILEKDPRGERKGGTEEIEIEGEKVLLITGDSYGFTIGSWRPTECPPDILEIFKEYIGELAMKVWTFEEAVKSGYLPTEMHSQNPGGCIEWIRNLKRQQEIYGKLPRDLQIKFGGIFSAPKTIRMDMIVVDQKNHVGAGEDRYAVWARDKSQDN